MNIFNNIPEFLPEELTETLLVNKNVRLERIISDGQTSPLGFWYDQDETEIVFVLEGAGEIEYADKRKSLLKKGYWEVIPAHCRHRVSYTSLTEKTVWIAIFIS